MDEWKLKINNVAAFEHELQNFINHYIQDRREDGLKSISLGEWQAPGFYLTPFEMNQLIDALSGKIDPPRGLGSRPMDDAGQQIDPAMGRSWGVTFTRQSKGREGLFIADMAASFTVYMIGGEYPLLLKVGGPLDTARPFVSAWIERCKALWDAVPVTAPPAETSANNGPQGMSDNWILSKPFDVLDAAIERHLSDIHTPFLDFKKHLNDTGSYVYYMAHYIYGKIELQKLGDQRSKLYVTAPNPDDIDTMTPEQLADQPRYNPNHELLSYKDEQERQRWIEMYVKEIANRREMRARHSDVINELLDRLKNDGLFVLAYNAQPPQIGAAQPVIADNQGGKDSGIVGDNRARTITYSGKIHDGYTVALIPVGNMTTDMLNVHDVTSAGDGPQVISIQDERIAKIRSMFSGGNNPTDKKIATELIISESRAKQLRLKAGIKRRERKKSMS